MNPHEEKLAQFLEDTVMYSAVRGILEAQFDMNTLKADKETDNAVLGQITKAYIYGRDILEQGFKEIGKYKRSEVIEKDNKNIAL